VSDDLLQWVVGWQQQHRPLVSMADYACVRTKNSEGECVSVIPFCITLISATSLPVQADALITLMQKGIALTHSPIVISAK